MKVFIADPALKGHHGHHYAVTERFGSSLISSGAEVIWLVNKSYQLDESDEGDRFKVDLAFSEDTYSGYRDKSVRSGLFRFLEGLGGFQKKFICELKSVYRLVPTPLRVIARRVYRSVHRRIYQSHPGTIKEKDAAVTPELELLQSLNRLGFSPDDCVIFHTSDAYTYRDVLAFFTKALSIDMWNRFPLFILSTPYDTCVMPHNLPDELASHSIKYMQTLNLLGSRVFLCAENELLADQLATEWGVKVTDLYLPHDSESVVVNDVENNSAINFAYLGAARTEKGFVAISRAVIEYLSGTDKQDICFTMQITPQIMGYTSDVELAVNALKAVDDRRLSLLCDVQKPEEYKCNLLKADVLLLFYDAERYAVRSSGIAIEAMENAKNIITTEGTFPAYLAGDAGVAVKNPNDIIEAIREISDNFEWYRRAARDRQKWVIGKCSINRLYDVISSAKQIENSDYLFNAYAFNRKKLAWRRLI